MFISTDFLATPRSLLVNDPTSRWQAEVEKFLPRKNLPKTTFSIVPDISSDIMITSGQGPQESFKPPMVKILPPVNVDSIPLQIWEGTVVEVDRAAGEMHVLLDAKMGQALRHAAEIDLEWVSDQDEDLVRPGAVFYLTLLKRTKRGSIENSQELRFRRRPSWSATQLDRINEDASKLVAKMKALPHAE